jgi:TnpA family transposase
MTALERTAYPRFKPHLTNQELELFYTPTEAETAFVHQTAGRKRLRLTLLILLKAFQKLGYLPFLEEIPNQVKKHLAQKTGGLSWRKDPSLTLPTYYRYRQAIHHYLKIRPYPQGGPELVTQVVQQAALTMSDPADLINVAIEELVRQQFELPAYSTLDKWVNQLRHQVHQQLYRQAVASLTPSQKEQLEALLNTEPHTTRSAFHRLKTLPATPSLKTIRLWENHLAWMEQILNPSPFLSNLTPTKIEQFAAEAYQLEAGDISRIETDERRYTLLLCLLYQLQVRTRDQLTMMYLKRVRALHRKGVERLRQLQEKHRSLTEMIVDGFATIVQQAKTVAQLAEEERDKQLGQQVRQLLQEKGGAERLRQECESLQAYHHHNYLPLLRSIYPAYRPLFFRLTKRLQIRSANQNQLLLQALAFIVQHQEDKSEYISPSISLAFVGHRWLTLVQQKIQGKTLIQRHFFEICVFSYLADGLENGDLYVVGSEIYADYRTQLLSWEESQKLLPAYCQAVSLPQTAIEFVESLQQQFGHLAQWVDSAQMENTDLSFDKSGKPHLKRLPRRVVSEKAEELKRLMKSRLPEHHLLDILHHVHHWTPYSRHFGPPSGADPKLQELVPRYLMTIFGYGCNLGPVQMARHTRGGLSARVLGRINAQHLTAEKLDEAIRDIIAEYVRFPLPFFWGTGRAAVSDGTHYELYENNLLGEQHIRYGAYGGIAYHHISDTYIALFSHFIACGVWEAVYILDGLLQNKSVLQPDTVHADTQGQSEVVFGLAYLLGIKLMPRMRNWNKVTMYRPDKELAYQHIEAWFTRSIKWQLIYDHWQDLMQVVLAIHVGRILPSWLLQKLRTDNPKNTLYLAFRELGRVSRTMFLLTFASDPNLREQVYGISPKVEAYHNFSRWIFFGGDGLIPSRDPVEYEKRIKYKDLIANAVMLHNVVDMTHVLTQLVDEGYEVTADMVATFSPYLTEHIRRFGEYVLDTNSTPLPLQPDMPFLTSKKAKNEPIE